MNRPTQPQSSRLRVQAATSAVNAPIECPSCGSIFFIEAQAGMYTTSGAGYRNVNQGPQKVYLCPCGEIMIPPTTPPECPLVPNGTCSSSL